MPELPEVETVVRQLRPALQGRRVRGLEVYDALLGPLPTAHLVDRQVEQVFRLGKQVVLHLGSPEPPCYVVVHLRMTGRLILGDAEADAGQKHLRAQLLLDQGSLCFYDARRFGTIKILDLLDSVRPAGVDPLNSALTPVKLRQLLRGSIQAIKAWLLRQDRLVGLGNIYASEILFEARIDPRRHAGSLTGPEIKRLHHSTVQVLRRAIEHSGTTFSDFQDSTGLTGSYQSYLKVYKRDGQHCLVCDRLVQRLIQQQRSTFFCPRCQHNPRHPAVGGSAAVGGSGPPI